MSTAVFGALGFRARSGREVRASEDGSVSFHLGNGYIGAEVAGDAEEFFQAKRDRDLGRWRWPENPDWLITPTGNADEVSAYNEREAANGSFILSRGGENWPHAKPAVDAYFEAHPERKPWQEARPEEAWLLTIDGKQWVATVDSMLDFSTSAETFVNGSPDMARITDGRRIWPEDAS